MKIEFKSDLSEFNDSVSKIDKSFRDEKEYSIFSLVNKINSSEKLNDLTIQNSCFIEFKDFNFLSSLNKKFKNIFHSDNTSDAQYNKHNQTVTLGKKLFKENKDNLVFLINLSVGLHNKQDYLNLILIHELGHAADDLNNDKNTILDKAFKRCSKTEVVDVEEKGQDASNFLRSYKSMIHENIADLYVCAVVTELYPEAKAKSLIESFKQARLLHKEYSRGAYLDYQTDGAIEYFQKNYKKEDIKNYSQLKNFFNEVTEKMVWKRLNDELSNDTVNSPRNLSYVLGEINCNLKLNAKNPKETIEKLNELGYIEQKTIEDLNQLDKKSSTKPVNYFSDHYSSLVFTIPEHHARMEKEKNHIVEMREKFNKRENSKSLTL